MYAMQIVTSQYVGIRPKVLRHRLQPLLSSELAMRAFFNKGPVRQCSSRPAQCTRPSDAVDASPGPRSCNWSPEELSELSFTGWLRSENQSSKTSAKLALTGSPPAPRPSTRSPIATRRVRCVLARCHDETLLSRPEQRPKHIKYGVCTYVHYNTDLLGKSTCVPAAASGNEEYRYVCTCT